RGRRRNSPLWRASAFVLGQAVGDLVIVALLADEDVHLQMRAGGRVEGAERDRGPVQMRRIPEQDGAAGAAEAAADLVGGLEPGDLVHALHGQFVARDVGRGPIVAGLAAALDAVAGVAGPEFALDLEADRAAEAGAFVHQPAGVHSTCILTGSLVFRPAGTTGGA